jgi:hypothetical protein
LISSKSRIDVVLERREVGLGVGVLGLEVGADGRILAVPQPVPRVLDDLAVPLDACGAALGDGRLHGVRGHSWSHRTMDGDRASLGEREGAPAEHAPGRGPGSDRPSAAARGFEDEFVELSRVR